MPPDAYKGVAFLPFHLWTFSTWHNSTGLMLRRAVTHQGRDLTAKAQLDAFVGYEVRGFVLHCCCKQH